MADEENITFMDLACLFKVTPETTLERFGSTINASIFDAANISGSLKQKGLVEFTAYYPGPNSIVITDAGKKLKEEADAKSTATLDNLDDEILVQLSGGKRVPLELQNTLNLRPRDLALRIYKLSKQNYLSYDLKNGGVELMLTEQGFLKARTQQVQAPQAPGPAQKGAVPGAGQQSQDTGQIAEEIMKRKKGRGRKVAVVAVLVIVILLAVYYAHYYMLII